MKLRGQFFLPRKLLVCEEFMVYFIPPQLEWGIYGDVCFFIQLCQMCSCALFSVDAIPEVWQDVQVQYFKPNLGWNVFQKPTVLNMHRNMLSTKSVREHIFIFPAAFPILFWVFV